MKTTNIFLTLALLLSTFTFAQVGIGTTAPKNDLHLLGDGLRISIDDSATAGTYYVLPNTDGAARDILTTDGAGAVSWAVNTPTPSVGSSSITQWQVNNGLWTPHADTCAPATEAFIPVYPGATVGICIDNAERAAVAWTTAIAACASAGKRLPENYEWKISCDSRVALGLTSMINNSEWTSNFPSIYYYSSSTIGNAVSTMGAGSCNNGRTSFVNNSNNVSSSHNFRCVY
jgi:hypothetical protein